MQIRVDFPQRTGKEVLSSNSNWMRKSAYSNSAVSLREEKYNFLAAMAHNSLSCRL